MIEINNLTRRHISRRRAAALTDAVLARYRRENNIVSLALVGDSRMRRLNRAYRGLDKTTDVLSFPALPAAGRSKSDQGSYLGELVINLAEASRLSRYLSLFLSIGREDLLRTRPERARKYLFDFLLVHGLLHLLGYCDKTPAQWRQMMAIGRKLLGN